MSKIEKDIELLRNGDEEAWLRVRDRAVRVEMNRFRHSKMVRDWSLSEDGVPVTVEYWLI